MKVSGSQTVEAPREAVFAAICDPHMLLEVIPGCQDIIQVSDNEYRARIALRLPAIVGTYDTTVKLVRAEAPVFGELEGRMVGSAGTIAGRAVFHLAQVLDETRVEYVGSAIISGPLARLDSRFVEGFAKSIVSEGLARLGERLQRVPATASS